jgi:hydroxymethylbilane synthase
VRDLVIGTRGSALARWQAEWVRERLRALGRGARLRVIRTEGDRIAGRPLAAPGGKGVFVREIEDALLAGSIDLAVHSLKDLPTEQPSGLAIACIPAREDPRDVLVAPGAPTLATLPSGAVVGTGSPRRACQILAARRDLRIGDLRGNVDTRLRRLAEGRCDAVVLALAGLRRLGVRFEGRPLEPEVMIPAVGQGALAVETRAEDDAIRALLQPLHHAGTAAEVRAERAFLRGLGGGCRTPIAASARADAGALRLTGLVADPAGESVLRDAIDGDAADPEAAGTRLARALLARGAADLLARPAGALPGAT